MKGKLIEKNDNWYIEFENGIKRRFYADYFMGGAGYIVLGYVLIKGKKIDTEIDADAMTAATY